MSSTARTLIGSTLGVCAVVGTYVALAQSDDPDFGRAGRLSVQHLQQHAKFLADREPTHELAAQSNVPCANGSAGIYPCENVDLLSFVPLSGLGGGQANDIWGWTDSVTGSEYALVGRTTGMSVVDISDPMNPVYVGNLPTHTSSSLWRDIKVYADHAYVVSEAFSHGMQVFDLTELRSVGATPVTFSATTHYGNFGNAHNVVINEDSGFAYAVGTNTCSGGLHVVDIQNPVSPQFAGCVSEDGYTHDAQCVNYIGPDPDYQGREICVNANEDTITIFDVTDKGNPLKVSVTYYAGRGYTHQGWLTEDHSHFLLDDELDESNLGHNTRTRIFDVSDLDKPVLKGFHDGDTRAIDHNLYVVGETAYQANYRAGLTVLDISDVANANLSEVGFFDVYPTSNSASFNGAWSVYPFFDSGVVVVSGIEQGLFVLNPVLDEPALTLTNAYPGAAGGYNLWLVGNATPNSITLLYVGFEPGSSSIPSTTCPGLTMDIDPAIGFAIAQSDADGAALLWRFIPDTLAGVTLLFQAVDFGSCVLSNVTSETF